MPPVCLEVCDVVWVWGFVPTTPSLPSCVLVCAAEVEGCSED